MENSLSSSWCHLNLIPRLCVFELDLFQDNDRLKGDGLLRGIEVNFELLISSALS